MPPCDSGLPVTHAAALMSSRPYSTVREGERERERVRER
jgi:hypothetical protein